MTLDTCHDARGVVVVVDVLRAFTTAAYAFAGGAEEIFLVSTVEEAFSLRKRNSD
jgi:2-phosphosulfolactate phosphatase